MFYLTIGVCVFNAVTLQPLTAARRTMQAPSPASSHGGRMRALMAQVTSLSDRVASLTAERPGRALSSGARSPASSRTDGAEALFRGAGGTALLPMRPWSPSRGPEPVLPPVRADPRGRAHVAPFSAAGSRLLSPDMRGKGASGGASPPLGPAAGVVRRAEQELASHAGRGSPTLPAHLRHVRDGNAPPHDRSAAAARRILDCLGLGYGTACHNLALSERNTSPAGAAEGMQPVASGSLASGAAGPPQGAREGRGGDPLSVVHIFAGQLAARMAAGRQRSLMAAGGRAAVGGAAGKSAEESELRDSIDAVGDPAAHPAAVTPQVCMGGEQRSADLGAASCPAAEVAGGRSAALLQRSALDRPQRGSRAISDPVLLLSASMAAEHCGADVQRGNKGASSSPAAAPADGPATASLGRAAHSAHSKAFVAEACVPAVILQNAADLGAAAAVTALQGPLPAAAGAAEPPRGAIPRLLAWLDAAQPHQAQQVGAAYAQVVGSAQPDLAQQASAKEGVHVDAAQPGQAQCASAAQAQQVNAPEPDQAQRADAEEAMRPPDCAAHAATYDPEATAAADPNKAGDPLPVSTAGVACMAAARPDPYPDSSTTVTPSAPRVADGLDEGSGAGGSASPTASPESAQRASHASSVIAACETMHSRGSSVGHGSPGLPASPHAADSAAAAEDGPGLEHAQGVFLHVSAGASSQGGSTTQPLRSSSSSPAASVAEEEWLQRSPDKALGPAAAAPASPVAAAAALPLPGTPDARRLLTQAQMLAEAAPAALAPGGCLQARCAEVMAGERSSAAIVADAQGGGADTTACESVCSPAADIAAVSVDSQQGSGGAMAGAPEDSHLLASATAPSCSPRHSPCSSPESGGGALPAAPADACAAVQGAAGGAADSLGGLCPGPYASPVAEGSGHASAASSVVHSPPSPATQALSEEHPGLAADGALSRAMHPAASLGDGALADQQARAADSAGTEAAAGHANAPSGSAPGRLSAQHADDVAAALLDTLLADATAEIVSAAVQALGDATSADAAARLSLDAACARSPRGWAPPPSGASGLLQKGRPGSADPAMDSERPRVGTLATEQVAAATVGKAAGREKAASASELDLLSTESCAWLRAEDGRADCAADTPRGERDPHYHPCC